MRMFTFLPSEEQSSIFDLEISSKGLYFLIIQFSQLLIRPDCSD